jgi:dihydrolipoyl dehydrogenase
VGLSEDQCKEQGIAYKCRKGYYRSNGKAHAGNATEGMIKLMTDENDRILGCHLYGENAAFIAQEVAVLMNFGATLSQLGEIVHTHPTLSEILQDMAFMP